jgi:hypothetical protein
VKSVSARNTCSGEALVVKSNRIRSSEHATWQLSRSEHARRRLEFGLVSSPFTSRRYERCLMGQPRLRPGRIPTRGRANLTANEKIQAAATKD